MIKPYLQDEEETPAETEETSTEETEEGEVTEVDTSTESVGG